MQKRIQRKRARIDGWLLADEQHKTVMKDFSTKRSYCAEPKCKFYGKLAEQAVCFHNIPDAQSRYYDQQMKDAEHMLAFNRKHNYKKLSQKQIMKHMESEIVCHFMNYSNCLDELVWLRGENAKLRGKLGIFRKV